jgi:hypothetical protein
MVQVAVALKEGRVYAYATAAGYIDADTATCSTALSTLSLTASVVLAAWNSRTAEILTSCDPSYCYGYGVRTLVYTFQGIHAFWLS